jgi:Prenyltransferase and squalene oxidase repeat
MADVDAAIGFVVARGDQVDRARLSWLRSGIAPGPEILARVEHGQTPSGGWPAFSEVDVASIDATCYRLAELDDLGALDGQPARRALAWLAGRQQPDGMWEEDPALARDAPDWLQPGNPEARLYLTANAGYWLAVGGSPALDVVARATQAFRASLREDGTWPSYLAAGWLGGALLYHAEWFYEAAQIQMVLAERVPQLSPANVADLAATFRRAGLSHEDWLLAAARKRLTETQRSDGGWSSDDGDAFDVHTTLTAIRALR